MAQVDSIKQDVLPTDGTPAEGGLGLATLPGGSGGLGLINVLGGSGGLGIVKPYTSKIFLAETYIAGTTHIEEIDELTKALSVGDRLLFRRDIDNEHDESAISIITENGATLGFVPQKSNEMISRLMDGGKVIFAEVAKCELRGTWHKISIGIYFED